MIKVKLFDREHEKDLEWEMNRFLKGIDDKKLIDIKYNVAALPEDEEEEQIYCFTAMIIYRS
ncbi:sporulation protein Cse60 [Bacillota bacterium Lsc_1132]